MRKWIYVAITYCLLFFSAFITVHADSSQSSQYTQARSSAPRYSWHDSESSLVTLSDSIKPPSGYKQITIGDNSFGAWLRGLPLLQNSDTVYLFNGDKKFNQLAHHSIIDIDVGSRDLQQCADAAMRLRAEYLYSKGDYEKIHFNFTSGDKASWLDWAAGIRPVIKGNQVSWKKKASKDRSYRSFRRYLDVIFTYAGSASLSRELKKVVNPAKILPGDVFIQGGYPGHAVIVIDVANNDQGDRIFLLAQSYMPAQQIHVLNNPKFWNGPWYHAKSSGKLITPEWIFNYSDLMRF